MEELILERLEESVDALFVAVADEFRKVIDEIHLDKEKEELFAIKVFDSAEAIRARKNLHHSGRWGKEQHRVVFYNRKIDECSWFVQNLLVSNTPRSLKDGEIRRCAELLTQRTNALIKKIRVIDSFREVNLRIFLQSAFNRRVAIPVLLHLRIAVQRKDYDAAEHYLRLAAPGLVFFEHLFADEETPLAEDEENGTADEASAVEEDDSEDEQSDEVNNENDAPLDRKAKQGLEEYKGWFELSENERQRVLDTLAVYMGLPSAIHEFVCAPKRLQTNIFLHEVKRHFDLLSGYKKFAEPGSIRYHEGVLRARNWKVINGVENFRDSQMYNALVKLYPTYKEELQ